MISQEEVDRQLKKLKFNPYGWGRGEVRELSNLMMPGEKLERAVNGTYEGGFALLVASKERILLVDKKPLNNLKFEDLRFDMISEFDYSHSVIGASVCISSGYKTLKFTSLNQQRLRHLLSYVQNRMIEVKKVKHQQREAQQKHLEAMNEQLRQYFISAQQQALEQQRQLLAGYQQQTNTAYRTDYQPRALNDQSSFEEAAASSIQQEVNLASEQTQADLSELERTASGQQWSTRPARHHHRLGLAAAQGVARASTPSAAKGL